MAGRLQRLKWRRANDRSRDRNSSVLGIRRGFVSQSASLSAALEKRSCQFRTTYLRPRATVK